MNTPRVALLLGSLYLAQGLPYGFLTQTVPVLLRLEGASLTTISASRMLLLPWLLKALWAPLVDRWHNPLIGRRRTWLLSMQAASVLLFLCLGLAQPDSVLPLLLWTTFLASLFAATQDIAADGLAVSLLRPEQRGWGNGLQVAAYRLGMALGGGALLVAFASYGWLTSTALMAVLLALCSLPVLLWREPPSEPPTGGALWVPIATMLRRPGMGVWLGLIFSYKLGEQAGGSLVKPFLVDAGMDLEDIGWLGAFDSLASLAGAIAGGLLTTRLGTRCALVTFGVAQAALVGAWVWPALSRATLHAAAVTVVDGFIGSMATAALFTAMMERVRPADGGTDFTLQASVVLLASFVAGAVAGPLADGLLQVLPGTWGFAASFAFWALISALGAIAVMKAPTATSP
jgi:PAT family beta-lactamase induction signal transducer AmpG